MAIPSTAFPHLVKDKDGQPRLTRPYFLRFIGDWGGANFHRICSWLTQEFCDRAGPRSRTSITSLRDGGMDSLIQVDEGEADLAIVTPAALMKRMVTGGAPFPRAFPNMRALAVLPQNDRMVLAVSPKYGVKTIEELRKLKPALRIATSINDGTNFIGYVADRFMEAHGIQEETLKSWGGSYHRAHRPEQCVAMVENGGCDALLQEAIMTPWWKGLIETNQLVPLPAESEALSQLQKTTGLLPYPLPAGYWDNLTYELPALGFADFMIVVRDDLPKEVAFMLTWCLVETRHMIETQYCHIPPERSPLSYPLVPEKMAKTPIPLHEGAMEYYRQAGLLADGS
jgi:uncharacterized protein